MDKIDRLNQELRQQHERLSYLEFYILKFAQKSWQPFIKVKVEHPAELELMPTNIAKSNIEGYKMCVLPENLREGEKHSIEVKERFIEEITQRRRDEQAQKISEGNVVIRERKFAKP